MTTNDQSAPRFLEALIRQTAGEPAIMAAFVGGPLAEDQPDPYAELDLYLVAPDGFRAALPGWARRLGELAHVDLTPDGCRLVTADGLPVNMICAPRLESVRADRLKPIFNRSGEVPAPPELRSPGDLTQEAARFWDDLYRAGAALGRGQVFTAHGRLERCRERLANLYRLALTPGRPEAGWEGLDSLPGASALDGLKAWLVAPLDLRAQHRCATRLAAAFESLMLPLTQKLNLSYPWAMRKLAFQRLEAVHPDRAPDVAVPPQPEPAPEPVPAQGAARLRVKGRIRRPG